MWKDNRTKKMDLHYHTTGSSDAQCSFSALKDRAVGMRMEYIAPTDHNNLSPIMNYLTKKSLNKKLAYHDIDGVKLIPAVECTCRIEEKCGKNKKGKPSKVHLLVYAPEMLGTNLFVKLMKIKHINDIEYDFGPLIQMANLKDVEINEKDLRSYIKIMRDVEKGFSSLGKNSTYDYFRKYYPKLFKSWDDFESLYHEIQEASRLNLNAKDVVDFAHSAGAFCTMAHPSLSMAQMKQPEKSLDCLIDYGLDGFETMYPSMNKATADIIKHACERHTFDNPIIETGGSDFHRPVGWRDLGRFKDYNNNQMLYIRTGDFPVFKKEIEQLNEVRKDGVLTHRKYTTEKPEIMKSKFEEMKTFVEENKCWEGKLPVFDSTREIVIPEFDKELELIY